MNYPKPGPIGGKLLREIVGTMRAQDSSLALPLSAHILIAVSGGVDSMALARLLVRYGRRVAIRERIRLVHINHGWRGKESDADAAFVREAAKRWGVPISVFRLKPVDIVQGMSAEEAARLARKRIFDRLVRRYGTANDPAWIFTAHHADDLAETLVWRFCTGTLQTHGAGIAFREGQELRPVLRIRKKDLAAFLKEEGETWREDRSNFEGRFMRSRMRLEVMPILEQLFPKMVSHLVESGLGAQKRSQNEALDPGVLFAVEGIRARRAHWDWLKTGSQRRRSKVNLPGGWVLRHELDRWILEKQGSDTSKFLK